MDILLSPSFWISLLEIAWLNIILSGDNAIVIAIATRHLPPVERKKALFWGVAVAVVLRILLTLFAVELLQLPGLRSLAAALLIWIGSALYAVDDDETSIAAHPTLFAAIRTILLADLATSLDNVLAIAATADASSQQNHALLVICGLGLSIPIVIFGSRLVSALISRLPLLVMAGALFLGWIAGDMSSHDALWQHLFPSLGPPPLLLAASGAALVLLLGRQRKNRPPQAPNN